MYIILKNNPYENDEVINLFYCQDSTIVRAWVQEYIKTDIVSLMHCPLVEGVKAMTYELNDADKNLQLIKRYKRVNKGYIYNSSDRITEIVYSISILEFDSENTGDGLHASNDWKNINNEINRRILGRLDKESLFQIFVKVQGYIDTKRSMTSTEYTGFISEIISKFKKELYSSVAKVRKEFKRTNDYVPENFNQPRGSCKLESRPSE